MINSARSKRSTELFRIHRPKILSSIQQGDSGDGGVGNTVWLRSSSCKGNSLYFLTWLVNSDSLTSKNSVSTKCTP